MIYCTFFFEIFFPQKTGKWNAMHAHIAWGIFRIQQKQAADAKAGSVVSTKTDLLRPPGHLYPGGPGSGLGIGAPSMAPPFPTNMPPTHPAPPPPHPVGFLSSPASHLGNRGNKGSVVYFCFLICSFNSRLNGRIIK